MTGAHSWIEFAQNTIKSANCGAKAVMDGIAGCFLSIAIELFLEDGLRDIRGHLLGRGLYFTTLVFPLTREMIFHVLLFQFAGFAPQAHEGSHSQSTDESCCHAGRYALPELSTWIGTYFLPCDAPPLLCSLGNLATEINSAVGPAFTDVAQTSANPRGRTWFFPSF